MSKRILHIPIAATADGKNRQLRQVRERGVRLRLPWTGGSLRSEVTERMRSR